jgi:uncharacterized protein YfiM (DUF2279 family)
LGLWERFITAIARIIAVAPSEKQRDAGKSRSNQSFMTAQRALYFVKFHNRGGSGQKTGQSDRKRNSSTTNIELSFNCLLFIFILFYTTSLGTSRYLLNWPEAQSK